jgi:hypothetical protein
VFIFIACKKNKNEFKYFGSASATMNGRTWNAGTVRCVINIPCYKGKLGFGFKVYNQQGFLRESLIFSKIPIKKGNFLLSSKNYNDVTCIDTLPTSEYFTAQDDGDVLLDSYNAIPSPDNYFTIEDYNERTKELRGSFAVAFKIVLRGAVDAPDTIRVTNGKFYTKVLD